MREAGFYRGIPNTEYHRGLRTVQDGQGRVLKPLSSTGAKTLLFESPGAYLWGMENPEVKKAYDIGNATHELILEGGFKDIVVSDQFENFRKKEAQSWRDDTRLAGKVPMLAHELEDVYAMRDSVAIHPRAASLLAEGEPELSGLIWDEQYEIWYQIRLDWLRPDGVIIDLKQTKDSNPEPFYKQCAQLKYHLSAAMYLRGARALGIARPEWAWVAVQNTAPHPVSVHELSPDDLATGDRLVHAAFRKYAASLKTGDWPWHPNIYGSNLPRFAEFDAERVSLDE